MVSSPIRLALAAVMAVAAFPAFAQDKPTLTIYTYDGFDAEWGPGPAIAKGFEEECGCTVNWVGADSSIGALRRIQLEGDSTQADILLGIDSAVVGEALATGLFIDHGVDTSAVKVPNDWSSPQFVPFDYGYFAFVYNKDKVANPPHSFEELINEPEDFKIFIQDPRSATPGLGLVLWIKAAYGDDAAKIWQGMAPHIVSVTRDWSESYSLFLNGESDMVLSYTTSPAYHEVEEDDHRFAAAKFDEGHYTQIEVAGILKSSQHQELARQFLAYMITPEAQKVIPHTNWMLPVTDIGEVPEGFDDMIKPDPALLLDDEAVAKNARSWVEEALNALN